MSWHKCRACKSYDFRLIFELFWGIQACSFKNCSTIFFNFRLVRCRLWFSLRFAFYFLRWKLICSSLSSIIYVHHASNKTHKIKYIKKVLYLKKRCFRVLSRITNNTRAWWVKAQNFAGPWKNYCQEKVNTENNKMDNIKNIRWA